MTGCGQYNGWMTDVCEEMTALGDVMSELGAAQMACQSGLATDEAEAKARAKAKLEDIRAKLLPIIEGLCP